MTRIDVRMRCLEAVAGTGVREPERLIRDAARIEEWVMKAGELDGPAGMPETDKVARRGRPPKAAVEAA